MMNIVKINTLDSVLVSEKTFYEYDGKLINAIRVNNDMYGNPLYHVSIYDNKTHENITSNFKGKMGRFYKNKGYITIQSYNLSNSLEFILK